MLAICTLDPFFLYNLLFKPVFNHLSIFYCPKGKNVSVLIKTSYLEHIYIEPKNSDILINGPDEERFACLGKKSY